VRRDEDDSGMCSLRFIAVLSEVEWPLANAREIGRWHEPKDMANGLRISVKALDEAIIAAVADRLEPAVVAEAVRTAAAELSASQTTMCKRRAALERELAIIAARMARLVDAIAGGDERDTVSAEIASLDTAQPLDVDALVHSVTARAADSGSTIASPDPDAANRAAHAGRRAKAVAMRAIRQR